MIFSIHLESLNFVTSSFNLLCCPLMSFHALPPSQHIVKIWNISCERKNNCDDAEYGFEKKHICLNILMYFLAFQEFFNTHEQIFSLHWVFEVMIAVHLDICTVFYSL